MQTNSDNVERINQILMLVVGTFVVGAMGVAGFQYGPRLASNIRDFYHPPAHARPQPSETLMKHVKTTNFEMSDEMRQYFDAKAAEFEANKRLGESYRMPPPRRP
jgi:hypothetical protein